MYIATKQSEELVIPFHRCRVSVEIPDALSLVFDKIYLLPFPRPSHGEAGSLTVRATSTEAILNRAGTVELTAYGKSPFPKNTLQGNPARLEASLAPAHDEPFIVIRENLSTQSAQQGEWAAWGDQPQ